MSRTGKPAFAALVLVLIQPLGNITFAADTAAATQMQLEQLAEAIIEIEQWIQHASTRHSSLDDSLRAAELELQQGYQQMQELKDKIQETREYRTVLGDEADHLRVALADQRGLVAEILRRIYIEGPGQQLKMILRQDDPSVSQRMLEYHRRLVTSRLQLVTHFRQQLAELSRLEVELSASERALLEQQSALEIHSESQQQMVLSREQILRELDQEIASQSGRLNKLLADRAALEALLDRIDQAVEEIAVPGDSDSFASLQGRLRWPVNGTLSVRYDDPFGDGSLRRQGVVISGEYGLAVHAIHSGNVVFADWLRGYGLLMIIDHGQGFMSLYGYNQGLAVRAGQPVRAGEIIAYLGNSGGQKEPGVYFEIRHNGRAHDPADWCLAIEP